MLEKLISLGTVTRKKPLPRNIIPALAPHSQSPSEGQSASMFLAVAGIVFAVLSIPFIVVAGQRTPNAVFSRPAFLTSASSDSDAETDKKRNKNCIQTTASVSDGDEDAGGRLGRRTDTGLSISSNETYIRRLSLGKIGFD
jgi:hypothetical protein